MKPRKVDNHGNVKWLIQYTEAGQRRRKYFDTRARALKWISDRENAVQQGGRKIAEVLSDDASLTDITKALQLLEPTGFGILEAVTHFIKHHTKSKGATVNEAAKLFMASKLKIGLKPRTIQEYSGDEAGESWKKGKGRIGKFMKHFDGRSLVSISTDEVLEYLDQFEDPTTWNHHYKAITALCNFSIKRKLTKENPTRAIDKRKVPFKTPKSYTPDQVQELLDSAPSPECELAVAIGALSGLRPEAELERLDWSLINLKEGSIQILAGNTKVATSQRFVTICPRLKGILKKHSARSGRIVPKHFINTREWKTYKKTWSFPSIDDGLRHTFATLHVAAYRNLAETSLQLGHNGSLSMLKMKYWNSRFNIDQKAAIAYFEQKS